MTTNKVLTRIHFAQILITCVIAGIGYLMLDQNQMVPIHWNIWGEVDNQWPAKWALLIGPTFAIVFLGIFAAIGTKEEGSWLPPLTSTILALAILIEAIILLSGQGAELNVPRLVTIAVGLLLIVVGNYLPKSQPNKTFGIRFPWTLNNPKVWARTNLFAGWFFMLVGAVCALFAAVLNVAASIYFAILIAGVLAAIIIISVYSYQLSKSAS
ncbi:SdpI family protein [Maritalea sp. S77]|uniref:SdpI family protein n=1 Tax=Maritalea sp. S77 TaxID=3415125 RepID=UPI003C7C8D5B